MSTSRGQIIFLTLTLLFFLAALVVSFGVDVQQRFITLGEGAGIVDSNLGFFFLINVNIIVVLVLAFLVIKNIVKLILDRRRRILGSHLRSRLVVAFVALSLVPAVLLFLVSKGIVGSVMQGWFSPQVTSIVDGAVGIARHHYQELERQLREEVTFLAAQVRVQSSPTALERYLREKRVEYGLESIALVGRDGRRVLHLAEPGMSLLAEALPLDPVALRDAFHGKTIVRPGRVWNGEFLQSYAAVDIGGAFGTGPAVGQVIITTRGVPPVLTEVLGEVLNSFDEYKQLRSFRRPIASSYLLTLAIVTLLVIFSAIWVGFYLARTLTEPIRLLAGGTAEVARGNLRHRIPETGDDELAILVRSFNTMTRDLAQTTDELVARRRYMETVLRSVKVGVISVDTAERVTTLNPAAAEILGLAPKAPFAEIPLDRVLPAPLRDKIAELRGELADYAERVSVGTISIFNDGRTKHVHVVLTALMDEAGKHLGTVILIDDLTELVSAQRIAAWREVAKRIAHEIKNPLTPIQLSAQRIQRRLLAADEPLDRELIVECARTIVNQVDAIRGLANEFARFAQMPNIERARADLNALLAEVVAFYRSAHPGVNFALKLSPGVPEFDFDREQMRRVVLNLLENAVQAIAPPGQIEVISEFNQMEELVQISVSDDGIGVPDREKPKVFEPYYSTKKGGTGLGLAMVSSIVADHGGFIRVQDSELGGAQFIIEIPTAEEKLRRQA